MKRLKNKFGDDAAEEVVKDPKAPKALEEAFNDMQNEVPREKEEDLTTLLGMWRSDLVADKDDYKYPEDED